MKVLLNVGKSKCIVILLISFLVVNVSILGFNSITLRANADVVVGGGGAIVNNLPSVLPISPAIRAQSGLAAINNNLSPAIRAQSGVAAASCTGSSVLLTVNKVVLGVSDASGLQFNIFENINNNVANGPFPLSTTIPFTDCLNVNDQFIITEDQTTLPSGFSFGTPTYVTSPSSGATNQCSGTVVANTPITCTITNTVISGQSGSLRILGTNPSNPSVTSNQQSVLVTPQGVLSSVAGENNTGKLTVVTHNVNNCKPQSSCAELAGLYPYVAVHKFQDNSYSTLTSFPGSKVGRTVDFFTGFVPEIQYDVSQEHFNGPSTGLSSTNVTTQTSTDCEGVIHSKDNKVCTINNYIYSNSIQNALGQLKIYTHDINNCKPQSSCASIIAGLSPYVSVHTFDRNVYSTLTSFPGSKAGRTVDFYIGGHSPVPIQYDVSAATKELTTPQKVNITTNTSFSCEGVIHPTDSKACFIDNIVSNQMTSQSPATLSTPSQRSNVTSPSNVTSARK